MFTHITATVLYALLAASVVFQVAFVARFAVRSARVANASQPKAPAPRPVATLAPRPRVRRRDYRLALRAARASVQVKS